jgi:hypothetical protein
MCSVGSALPSSTSMRPCAVNAPWMAAMHVGRTPGGMPVSCAGSTSGLARSYTRYSTYESSGVRDSAARPLPAITASTRRSSDSDGRMLNEWSLRSPRTS